MLGSLNGAPVVTCSNLSMEFLLTCEHVQISFLKVFTRGSVILILSPDPS